MPILKKQALDIIENCGEAYRNASDTIKKLMNQAIFEKFYISNGGEEGFSIRATFKAPFDQVIDPFKDEISQINSALRNQSSKLAKLIDIAKDHIREYFGCGLFALNNSTNMITYTNDSNFFEPNSSSKVLLVEHRRFELLTSSMPWKRSTK